MHLNKIILLIITILFTSFANVIVKMGMKDFGSIKDYGLYYLMLRTVTNKFIWVGLFSYGIAFIFYSITLSEMKLSIAYPIMASAVFVILTIVSVFLFTESLSLMKISGILLIAFGIWIISIAK